MNKDNRKVKYTRRVIKEAFCKLLLEKPIGKITIAELCKEADIHRGTFYKHYHDIYELEEKIEEELFVEFQKIQPNLKNSENDLAELTVKTILEQKEICKAILGDNGNDEFLNKIIELCRESGYSKYDKLNIDKKYYEMIYDFMTYGSINVIKIWIKNGFKEEPEEIIKNIRKLSIYGLEGYIKK